LGELGYGDSSGKSILQGSKITYIGIYRSLIKNLIHDLACETTPYQLSQPSLTNTLIRSNKFNDLVGLDISEWWCWMAVKCRTL